LAGLTRSIRKNVTKKGILAMISRLLASVAVLTLTGGMAAADYALTILHTNDFHARFEQISK
jgi:2',3'-cyclic-nucleotide 2'-phosphodiesterase (5'-nucleotidase family)